MTTLIQNYSKEVSEKEWDLIAEKREMMIQSNKDISLLYVTEPYVLDILDSLQGQIVLDCGCGTGHLSSLIAHKGKTVTGIDISGKSINIAKKKYSKINNLNFIKSSIEDHRINNSSYDICIANMVFMDIINIESIFLSIYNILKDNGYLCFTITHPCFWPLYGGYFYEDWFKYNSEICINSPLNINKHYISHSTHVHRPLEKYILLCKSTGFEIKNIEELYPKNLINNSDYTYDYPRFMGFLCQK